MRHAPLTLRASLCLILALASAGCGEDAAADAAPADAAAAAKPEPGHVTGRVTMADGKPVTVAGAKYSLRIAGVSGRGENVGFGLTVKPDGTFKQRLPDGIYYVPNGTITVPFEGKRYTLKLEPTNRDVGNRESAPGIVQDFVWKLTGPRPDSDGDKNNVNQWYGLTIPANWQTYRDDTKATVAKLPKGTKLLFTLKPTSKRIDGGDPEPLTVEREFRPDDFFNVNDALHDLPPANYEVSGVARLPDGSTKPILMRLPATDPAYVPSVKLEMKPSETMEHYWVPPIHWITD